MQNRSLLLAVAAGAVVVTPLVVRAAGDEAMPARPILDSSAAAPAGPAEVAPPTGRRAQSRPCARKVRVIYASGYEPGPACSVD